MSAGCPRKVTVKVYGEIAYRHDELRIPDHGYGVDGDVDTLGMAIWRWRCAYLRASDLNARDRYFPTKSSELELGNFRQTTVISRQRVERRQAQSCQHL